MWNEWWIWIQIQRDITQLKKCPDKIKEKEEMKWRNNRATTRRSSHPSTSEIRIKASFYRAGPILFLQNKIPPVPPFNFPPPIHSHCTTCTLHFPSPTTSVQTFLDKAESIFVPLRTYPWQLSINLLFKPKPRNRTIILLSHAQIRRIFSLDLISQLLVFHT